MSRAATAPVFSESACGYTFESWREIDATPADNVRPLKLFWFACPFTPALSRSPQGISRHPRYGNNVFIRSVDRIGEANRHEC